MADKLRMSTNELVDMVTTWLNSAIANNGSELKPIKCKFTYFHGRCPPDIIMQDYLRRLLIYSKHSNEVVVCALVYLQRLFVTYPDIDFAPETIH